MPGKRHPDQRLTAFTLDVGMARALESERKRQGKSRSQFVREAILEKLTKLGIPVEPEWAYATDRAGDYLIAESSEVGAQVGHLNAKNANFSSGASSKPYKQRRAKK